MSVTDVELIIAMCALVILGGAVIFIMYNIFKLIFDKFNELRKRL
jgi:hypothetical protein